MKKKVQYYKVVNTKNGHKGYFYKVGVNTDPNPRPLSQIETCAPGALYFTDAHNLSFFSEMGDSIAWITPLSKVKRDNGKWKAHTLKVTKILPIEKAILLIPELTPADYEQFGIHLTPKKVIENKNFSLEDKFHWLQDEGENLCSFIVVNRKNKKFLEYVINQDVRWEVRDVRYFLDNGLIELINEDTVGSLLWDYRYEGKNKKLMLELVQKLPELVLHCYL